MREKLFRSSKVRRERAENGWWTETASEQRGYEKKVKQFYSAAPAATAMTTMLMSTFLIDKTVLSFVIFPLQRFRLILSTVVSHFSLCCRYDSEMSNDKNYKGWSSFSFHERLWSHFDALRWRFFYDNTTIWLDFMLSLISSLISFDSLNVTKEMRIMHERE